MPIDLLPGYTPANTIQTVYDSQQTTLLGIVGELGGKVNECVEIVNEFTEAVDEQSAQIIANQYEMRTLQAAFEAGMETAFDLWKKGFKTHLLQPISLMLGWHKEEETISVGCWKDSMDVVHLVGKLGYGTYTPGTDIAQLPVDYRPSQVVTVSLASDAATSLFAIKPTGYITILTLTAGEFVSLDGVQFATGGLLELE